MDALDLLVDFATFLASSTTISKATNVESDAQKTVSPSQSTTLDEQHTPTSMSIKQESHPTADRKTMLPRESLPVEAHPQEVPEATRQEYYDEVSGLEVHPMLAPNGRQNSPGTYFEPYALEHPSDFWYYQKYLDERQESPSCMSMQQYGGPGQFGQLDWVPYPLFRTVRNADGMGQLVVAGDAIYRSSCSMGICNCRGLTPRLANTIPTSSNERYDAGKMFHGNAGASLNGLWMQWR
ncbi:hypothetical protein DE146DRAFT_99632 [Phaeosphaeria sp. MPI-PUGE-AT-0046c]|nr:hypothetical protein DE146DRAFT_99632 [Phaeosphaeria sp. MPI-PUGE-AT-0046c]